ncbi:hypothetical protein SAMN05444336_102245 [Albimonas donghaensis]|uniref:Uncharacterized protein n=1 Tax=Albimonas donghaensis TaxID=356660 RepID=A0A1H2W2F1_9RHOB|nr:DNA helicase [Albimonas donghaensis]SDW74733.1 hypothetical protein SAMN05444336_102245 [Albimonas donghaensis]
MLALALLAEAARQGRGARFFTLDWTAQETARRFAGIAAPVESLAPHPGIEADDDISARTIAARLSDARPGEVAVMDYLQALDQDRSKPPLAAQAEARPDPAARRGLVLVRLAQVGPAFDAVRKPVPDRCDLRRLNPLDLSLFLHACFLHGIETRPDPTA